MIASFVTSIQSTTLCALTREKERSVCDIVQQISSVSGEVVKKDLRKIKNSNSFIKILNKLTDLLNFSALITSNSKHEMINFNAGF